MEFLSERGYDIVAGPDSGSGTFDQSGLDLDELSEYKEENGTGHVEKGNGITVL